jgi:hypothetical protein
MRHLRVEARIWLRQALAEEPPQPLERGGGEDLDELAAFCEATLWTYGITVEMGVAWIRLQSQRPTGKQFAAWATDVDAVKAAERRRIERVAR